MKVNFGSRELGIVLECLGFIPRAQHSSSHQKYKIPQGKKMPVGLRPFIIVILGRKAYDPHTQSSYLRQIKNLGFSEEEIVKCLKES